MTAGKEEDYWQYHRTIEISPSRTNVLRCHFSPPERTFACPRLAKRHAYRHRAVCPECRAGDPVHEPYCSTLWGPGTRVIHARADGRQQRIISPLLSEVDQNFLDLALDLVLECAYGTETRLLQPGTISRVEVNVYDFALQLPKGPPVLSRWDRPLYSQLRQTALFKGASDYEWFERVHHLRHKAVGAALWLTGHERESAPISAPKWGGYDMGRNRGALDRKATLNGDVIDSIFPVYEQVTQRALSQSEQQLRNVAFFILNHIDAVEVALRELGFRFVDVEGKAYQSPSIAPGDEGSVPVLVLNNLRMTISLAL